MNKQSLDERIDHILLERYGNSITHADCDESCMEKSNYIELKKELSQAFKDVIQEVLPEKTSEDIISIAYTGKPDDAKEDWTPRESLNLSKGYNHAIDTINSNVDSLLTREKQ